MHKQKLNTFKVLDTNGDGKIDLEEYIDHFKTLGVNLNKEDAITLFKVSNILSFELVIPNQPKQKRLYHSYELGDL